MTRNWEKEFLTYLLNFPERTLKGIYIIDSEHRLYKPTTLLQRDFYEYKNTGDRGTDRHFGRIDIIFQYKGTVYCGEIKYEPHKNNDFWDAMKVLGYCTYYKWQCECNGGSANPTPAIIMPTSRIKLEHKIISGRLGIELFGIERKGDEFTMLPISEYSTADWKQFS